MSITDPTGHTVSYDPGEPPSYVEPVVLKVRHKGVPKMVGKIVVGEWREPVFLHATRAPSQGHMTTNSPGGIDAAVLDYLDAQDVRWVYHVEHDRIFSASTASIRERGGRRVWDGRDRYFLGWSDWADIGGVQDVYIPWIDKEVVL